MTKTNIFDLNALSEAKETMKGKFTTMVQYFLEDSESYIASIKNAMANNNVEAIISPAHTLKSSSRQMGAQYLSDIAMEIEAQAREQSSQGKAEIAIFKQLLADLESAFAETKLYLPSQI